MDYSSDLTYSLNCSQNCNLHSTRCQKLDDEILCEACSHNTNGQFCDKCRPGFYPDRKKNVENEDYCLPEKL